jgi:hypothetical protein
VNGIRGVIQSKSDGHFNKVIRSTIVHFFPHILLHFHHMFNNNNNNNNNYMHILICHAQMS